jgi:hypothetical protein
MKRIVATFIGLACVGTLACGNNPVAPTPPTPEPVPVTQAAPDPAPDPDPEPDPEPAPVPPAPVPPAAPAPEPELEPVTVATTDAAHWYGAPVLPATLEVAVERDVLVFGPLRLTIHQRDETSTFATAGSHVVQVVGARWTYTSGAGMASGTLGEK